MNNNNDLLEYCKKNPENVICYLNTTTDKLHINKSFIINLLNIFTKDNYLIYKTLDKKLQKDLNILYITYKNIINKDLIIKYQINLNKNNIFAKCFYMSLLGQEKKEMVDYIPFYIKMKYLESNNDYDFLEFLKDVPDFLTNINRFDQYGSSKIVFFYYN